MSNSVWPNRRQPTRLPIPGIPQARTMEWVAISFSNAWKWKVKIEREAAQSCPTLIDPMDCSPPGSSIYGIFQARVLVWGARGLACCNSWGCKELDTTEQLNWTELNWGSLNCSICKSMCPAKFVKIPTIICSKTFSAILYSPLVSELWWSEY